MNIETKKIQKNVKLVTGKTIERKGEVSLAVLRTPEDVKALLGENLEVFAAFGYKAYLRQRANNEITGSGKKEKDLKSALRNFKTSVEVLTKVMGMDESTAVSSLLDKEQFASVKVYVAGLADSSEVVKLDYTSTFPVPKFDQDEDEDADETE